MDTKDRDERSPSEEPTPEDKDDKSRGVEDEVDEQADETFPASDPPAW